MRRFALILFGLLYLFPAFAQEGINNPATFVTSKLVNSTYDLTTASGTQVVSGFGFTPSACSVFGAVNGTAINTYTTYSGNVDSAKNQAVVFTLGTTQNGFSNTAFIAAFDATAANNQVGVLSAYGAGSVSIAWTKGGTPTGTFAFSLLCFK